VSCFSAISRCECPFDRRSTDGSMRKERGLQSPEQDQPLRQNFASFTNLNPTSALPHFRTSARTTARRSGRRAPSSSGCAVGSNSSLIPLLRSTAPSSKRLTIATGTTPQPRSPGGWRCYAACDHPSWLWICYSADPSVYWLLPKLIVEGKYTCSRSAIGAEQSVQAEARGGRTASEINHDAAACRTSRSDVTY
jgi:hypothetical protein